MKIHYRTNLWAGILSIIMSILLFIIIPGQIEEDMIASAGGVTSRTFPYLIAVLFVICGLILVVKSLIFKKDEVKELNCSKELIVIGYIFILLLYGLSFKKNFLLTTSLLSIITLIFCRSKKKSYYFITVGTVIGLYFIFKVLLHVRLP